MRIHRHKRTSIVKLNYLRSLIDRVGTAKGISHWIIHKLRKNFDPSRIASYSQTGEDRIIGHMLSKIECGFYVDVGCFDPVKWSNTYKLYKKGWRGICIDANKDILKRYKIERPKDEVVLSAISGKSGKRTFRYFENRPAVNTLSQDHAETHGRGPYHEREVRCEKLSEVLDSFKTPKNIHLIDIDIEGSNFEAIKSLDLTRYRPWLICVEMHDYKMRHGTNHEMVELICENGYDFVGYCICNGYFARKDISLVGV